MHAPLRAEVGYVARMKHLLLTAVTCAALAWPTSARAECTGPDICLDLKLPVLPILYTGTTAFFVIGDLVIASPSSTYGFFEAALQGSAATYLLVRSVQETRDGAYRRAAGLGALAVGSGLLTWHGVHVFRRQEQRRKKVVLTPLPLADGAGLVLSGTL